MARTYWKLVWDDALESAERHEYIMALAAFVGFSVLATAGFAQWGPQLGYAASGGAVVALLFAVVRAPARLHERQQKQLDRLHNYDDAIELLRESEHELWMATSALSLALFMVRSTSGSDFATPQQIEQGIEATRARMAETSARIATKIRADGVLGVGYVARFGTPPLNEADRVDTRDFAHTIASGDRDYDKAIRQLGILATFIEEITARKAAL